MSDFKTRLRAEIEYSALLHKELAALAGVPKRTLDMYVGNRSAMPPADVAVRLAKVLGVSVEYLVTGENEHTSNHLSQQQKNILEAFNRLSEHEKYSIERLIVNLAYRKTQD